MVYDLRTSLATMAYRSRLHVQADALLLTSNLRYIVAVEQGCIVIFRMEDPGSAVPHIKYMTDNFPADDERLSDTDFYYDESVNNTDNQVFLYHSPSVHICVCFQ